MTDEEHDAMIEEENRQREALKAAEEIALSKSSDPEEIVCKRAEFLEKMGIDTAKFCDMCSIGTNEPDRTCWAMVNLEAVIAQASSLPQWSETEEEQQETAEHASTQAYMATKIAKRADVNAEQCNGDSTERAEAYEKAETAHIVAEEAHGKAVVAHEGEQDAHRQEARNHDDRAVEHSLAAAKAHTAAMRCT